MPFITEELWQRLAEGLESRPKSIAVTTFPQPDPAAHDVVAVREMEVLQEVVTAAREYRAASGVDVKQLIDVVVVAADAELRRTLEMNTAVIERLGRLRLELRAEPDAAVHHLRAIQGVDIAVRVQAMPEAQRQRLLKEIEQLEKNIANSKRQLSDDTFVSRAPAHVVDGIRRKLADYEAQLSKNREALGG
jgi:valyl-tRNA synthetase